MGMFKGMKKSLEDFQAGQQDRAGAQAAAAEPYDPNDPAFAPIEGVDCDKYAEVVRKINSGEVSGREMVLNWVESQGIAPDVWGKVQVGWNTRMQQHPQVFNRIAQLSN